MSQPYSLKDVCGGVGLIIMFSVSALEPVSGMSFLLIILVVCFGGVVMVIGNHCSALLKKGDEWL